MKVLIQRESLLKPLQAVCGVVERRQTLPILSNVLANAADGKLWLTATDLEVEMKASVELEEREAGEITLPARKFMDICRALPEGANIEISTAGAQASVRSGRSRFSLATLPAAEFPNVEAMKDSVQFEVPEKILKGLLDHTYFSMAQQDVRYYLNGLLLEVSAKGLQVVATDGHRLAICDATLDLDVPETRQVIVPRKGILELLRLLGDSDEKIVIGVGSNHIQVTLPDIMFTSKLIDGRFPDYQRVMPKDGDKVLVTGREPLRQGLMRASILSNEKYRGVRLELSGTVLRLLAHNPEQEEAEEEVEVDYHGGNLEIGFNVTYLIDVLSVLDSEEVQLSFSDANSSCLISVPGEGRCQYVVMPMRL